MSPNQPITHGEMQQMMDIISKNAEHSESIANSLKLLNEKIESICVIKKDIDFVKVLVAVISIAIVVSTVVLRGLDNRSIFKNEVKEIVKELRSQDGVPKMP